MPDARPVTGGRDTAVPVSSSSKKASSIGRTRAALMIGAFALVGIGGGIVTFSAVSRDDRSKNASATNAPAGKDTRPATSSEVVATKPVVAPSADITPAVSSSAASSASPSVSASAVVGGSPPMVAAHPPPVKSASPTPPPTAKPTGDGSDPMGFH